MQFGLVRRKKKKNDLNHLELSTLFFLVGEVSVNSVFLNSYKKKKRQNPQKYKNTKNRNSVWKTDFELS